MGVMDGLDKDLLATLTPEELAAMDDNEMSPDEIEAMKNIVGDDDDSDDDEDDDGDGDGDSGSVADSSGKNAAPIEDDSNPGDDANANTNQDDEPGESVSNAPADEFKPSYQFEVPADLEEQLAAVSTEKKDLAQKFREGEIDLDEFNTKSEELDSRRDDLNRIKSKADVFVEIQAQEWNSAKSSAFVAMNAASVKSDGIDFATDDAKFNVLNKHFTNIERDPAYVGKSAAFMISMAHRLAKAELGIESKSAPVPKDANSALKNAKEARKPPVSATPKTLATVPGGDGPGDVAGEFSNLDNLDGMDLEDAIAKMTPAQRERYLKAA